MYVHILLLSTFVLKMSDTKKRDANKHALTSLNDIGVLNNISRIGFTFRINTILQAIIKCKVIIFNKYYFNNQIYF